jgi:hypothetical protein
LFHYKKGEIVKLPTWVQIRPDHPDLFHFSFVPNRFPMCSPRVFPTFSFCDGPIKFNQKKLDLGGVKVRPKMVMNSFRKRSFLQRLGRPKYALKEPCIFAFLVQGKEGGGAPSEEDIFSAFPGSHYVLFKFPISYIPVPNMFPKFSMYSPTLSPCTSP